MPNMSDNERLSDEIIIDGEITECLMDRRRRMSSETLDCEIEEKPIRLHTKCQSDFHILDAVHKSGRKNKNLSEKDRESSSDSSGHGHRSCSNTNDGDADIIKSRGSCSEDASAVVIAAVSHTGVSSSGDDNSNSKTGHMRSISDSITSSGGMTRNFDSNDSLKRPFPTTHNSESQDLILLHRQDKEAEYSNNQKKSKLSERNFRTKTCSDSDSYSGYVGSNSSNDAFATSSSSSESSRRQESTHRQKLSDYNAAALSESNRASVSSDLADFSTGSNESSNSGSAFNHLSEDSEGCTSRQELLSRVPSPIVLRHHLKRKRSKLAQSKDNTPRSINVDHSIPPFSENWTFFQGQHDKQSDSDDNHRKEIFEKNCRELAKNFQSAVKCTQPVTIKMKGPEPIKSDSNCQMTPFYDLGLDVMAKVLSYLHPIEVYKFASMPLSKMFKSVYSQPQDLWKILCLSEPFYAKVDKSLGPNDEDSISSYPICKNLDLKHVIGRYRLLYSSFIKCVRYLERMQEDSKSGKVPAAAYPSDTENELGPVGENASLKIFFAKAQELKISKSPSGEKVNSETDEKCGDRIDHTKMQLPQKMKYGISKLTNSLLGPCHASGTPGNVALPWSCAIYSVVNWMVAFTDVPGIQLMCLKSLPALLVDEQMRLSAQTAGLTDIVLRAMVLYPNMADIHTAAFHSLVLLARPLGGKEGMLFHSAMVDASAIFNVGSATGKSGIAIMLDSMKRFVDNADLQAMACWSMVNIALIHSQKVVLVRLGGIAVAADAMIHHPLNAEVQFRALFALINLVIPAEKLNETPDETEAIRTQVANMNDKSELDMLNDGVEQVINLVVKSMKNFCSSEAILNRACLVLHNLSLNENNHRALLLTPNCYQMIEWCIANYRHDNVLQKSARGTLQRLQTTLSSNETLRNQFAESIRSQI